MRDCINLRREIGLPVLDETRAAVDEMEEMIVDLKLELLRHHPEQPPLPGMEDLPVAKEGELEANAS